MKELIEKLERLILSIRDSEFKNNPQASAKALEIKRMIAEMKNNVSTKNQGVLQYINPKVLLEN